MSADNGGTAVHGSSSNAEAKSAKGSPGSGTPQVVAGLFAGIGGIELGLSRSGHRTSMLCEIDEAACAVLDDRFPEIPKHGDVTTLARLPEATTMLTAGFPCQDLSQAGKTKGIRGARSGLVGEVFRLLEAQRLPWVMIENVPFMLQLAKGEALEVIVAALEHLGYRWAYRVVDSRAFGLPQRRRRVYMLASQTEDPRTILYADEAGEQPDPPKEEWHGTACGFYWTEGLRGLGWAHDAVPTLKGGSTVGIPSSPAIVLPDGRVVTPDIRDAERMQGFDSDWTEAAENVKKKGFRWKLVGNAVSVDAAAWVGRRLVTPGSYDDSNDGPLVKKNSWPIAAYNVDGERMMPASLSEWPLALHREPLAEFLRFDPNPLSVRAARGFHSRAMRAKLRFPPGFLDAVESHIEAQEREG
jgi:DNA (cytosine-5)-methyltransferase 1